ncbi:MAG: GNAT family N-acetyltransferase [Chloroflexota bacterium]|nr:GNAT family N-acetyltransferase [Chloroflexota bacterium]
MFDIQTQLFDGRDIRLGPIDYEKDPEVESRWTHDSAFMRMYEIDPARPMSAAMIKKQYEKLEKQVEEDKNLYHFMIRAKEDDRLIGRAAIQWIEWTNGNAWLHLGIGSAQDQRKGYGSQALGMLVRFAFAELNLFRLSARIPEYNQAAISLFSKFGFVEEIRRRQALDRDGRRWDLIVFGLLNSEWQHQAGPALSAVEGA